MIGAGAATLAMASPALAQQVTPLSIIQAAAGDGQRFDPAQVADAARIIAKRAFAPPPNDLPAPFTNLNYEQYVAIRARPEALIWPSDNRGFAIEPLHRGFAFANQVQVFIVEEGMVRRLGYDKSRFDFGRLTTPQTLGDIGFSGFRILTPPNGEGPATKETAIFQGATFFRTLAAGQNLGTMARVINLKTADSRGEEFPFFRAFWIERPAPGAGTLVVHGLFDSESTSGIVRFTLRPGEVAIVDVEATLFARSQLDHFGVGCMAGTFLFGPQSHRLTGDIRTAVYETSGLQMLSGLGEWIWRPAVNPEALQVSAFSDNNPKGFGLLQRERNYLQFQDDDQHFELRPSIWNEPLGDWGQGAFQLVEIPTDSDVNDNILAYWRPKQPVMAGAEFSFALRQFWCWTPPDRPPLATVAQTRTGAGVAGRRTFAVDFTGDGFADGALLGQIKPTLLTKPGAIANLRTFAYADRKTFRVTFELDPGSETLAELRLLLEAGGKPISETWLYRWTP